MQGRGSMQSWATNTQSYRAAGHLRSPYRNDASFSQQHSEAGSPAQQRLLQTDGYQYSHDLGRTMSPHAGKHKWSVLLASTITHDLDDLSLSALCLHVHQCTNIARQLLHCMQCLTVRQLCLLSNDSCRPVSGYQYSHKWR